jgi:hypothetical protein
VGVVLVLVGVVDVDVGVVLVLVGVVDVDVGVVLVLVGVVDVDVSVVVVPVNRRQRTTLFSINSNVVVVLNITVFLNYIKCMI